jgi:hypothetical protein
MRSKVLLVAAVMLGVAVPGLLGAEQPGRAEVKVEGGRADFLAGGHLAGRYHYADEWSKAKPILWPLDAPGGVPVTRAWPMEEAGPGGSKDHPHQKSAWFCHGDVIPEGQGLKEKVRGVAGVDFWSEGKGHGRIVCTSAQAAPSGKGRARLRTKNEWRTADGRKVLDESRVLTFYDFGPARLFVFDIDLSASVCPITFGDTKEGSMGVRVNDALREQGGKGELHNAEGKVHEKQVWGRQSAWCDYSGPVGGKVVGITLFDDPKNACPSCWHARGYGLMAANPFGRSASGFPAVRGRTDLLHLAKGEHLRLRYGILLHTGDAGSGHVAEYFQRFVQLRGKE